MNEDLRKNQPQSDEVDLGQLFNAIGRLFERFFRFIGSILTAIFSFIIFVLKVVIDNFKLILVVMIIASVLGFLMEKRKVDVYTSQMLVKPYFDSKYQLVSNINYFNTLISTQGYTELSTIFDISEESAKELRSFDVQPGPESDNEKVKAYGEFLESIDSLSATTFTYNEFIENRDIFTGDLFEINVESTKKDIFKSLEKGLNSTFKNEYSERLKQKRDTLLEIQKSNILATLNAVDSLSKVYISVLQEESRKGATKISFGEGLSLEPESKSKTKEFELLEREIELRERLTRLEEVKVQRDTYFDMVSGFQEVGAKTAKFTEKYVILFPLIGFIVLTIIFIVSRTIKFVRGYGR
ncbi:hypothetical protein [Gelidibacter maritimus]|uniref:Uncharacterized protein n=1 Tax=Gelidibacter maritimus TaxID=2761487 RepID=A0A7W2M3B3_9FLAO|nr:hypothetical protein [Gelidibacter maritimus]MBA6151943.1 hypothetical protein [Gelidibacter maritimus]